MYDVTLIPGDGIGPFGQHFGVLAGEFGRRRGQGLGRHIVDIVVVHGMQRIYQGDVEELGKSDPGKAHAKLGVDMDDIGVELPHQFEASLTKRDG